MLDKNDPIKTFEPIWDGWKLDSFIGEGSYGRVYKAVKQTRGRYYTSAVKHIQIPKTQSELTQARQLGMDGSSLYSYFEDMSSVILKEVDIMFRLKGEPNIVGYRDYSVVHEKGQPKWDIFIRMEYLETLSSYMERTLFSESEIIRLGVEICDALAACKKHNVIHRDVKESNIFVDKKGTFKLGDFGIAREASERSRSMSMRGTPAYLAPEIARGKKYSSNVDIYSLGILLYKLLNHGRYPFMPPAPQPIRFEDTDKSLERRLSGEPLPRPATGSEILQTTVLKACSYQPSARFQTPEEFKDALLGKVAVRTVGTLQVEESPDTNARVFLGGSAIVDSQRQGTRALFSYSEKTTSTENSGYERTMAQETTLRRREETKKQLERIRKQKEKKRRKTWSIILYSAVGCAAAFGIVLVARLINKGATGEQALNAVSATNIEVGTDSLNQSKSSNDKLGVTATSNESSTSITTPLTGGLSMTPAPNGTPMHDSLAVTPTPTAYSQVSYGNWSSWADVKPADKAGRDIEKRYGKKTRETKTSISSNDALNGWQIIDTKVETNYGNWSEWSTTACSSSISQEVETRISAVQHKEYKLFRYEVNFEDANKTYLPCECNARVGTPWDWAWNGGSSYSEVVSNSFQTKWVDDLPGYNERECDQCGQRFCDYWGMYWFSKTSGPETRTVEGEPITEYRSRSIIATTTYYLERWTDWSNWQNTTITADSNTQVRVQYRYRDKLS